jgi:hypothetical protein
VNSSNYDEFNTITRKVLRERRREVEFEENQRRRRRTTTTKHLPEAQRRFEKVFFVFSLKSPFKSR